MAFEIVWPRTRAILAEVACEFSLSETQERSEVNSNCRYRLLNNQTTT